MAQALVKRYGDLTAIDHVDLEVRAGDVHGLLGPNGAGKTTFMRMLFGLVRPDEGAITTTGRVAGFVEAPRFYPYLSARKNLLLLARLDDGDSRSRIEEVLETVDLTDRAGAKVRELSFGMVQRLGVAAALMCSPDLLVLDEPTNGLDPAGIRDMRVLVRRLADQGITILLSSHHMAEVDEVCDRVTIMRAGAVAFDGSLGELRGQADRAARFLQTDDNGVALTLCRTLPGVWQPRLEGAHVAFEADDDTVERLVSGLVHARVGVRSVHAPTSALETLFFRLTETGPTGPAGPTGPLEPAA